MDGRTTIVDFGARLFQYVVLKLKKSDFDACADEGETSGRGGPMQRARFLAVARQTKICRLCR